jgi:hypothetical protein
MYFNSSARPAAASAFCNATAATESYTAVHTLSLRGALPIYWFLHRLRRKVERAPVPYCDPALVMPESDAADRADTRHPEPAAAA